jgi:hypothetical protein
MEEWHNQLIYLFILSHLYCLHNNILLAGKLPSHHKILDFLFYCPVVSHVDTAILTSLPHLHLLLKCYLPTLFFSYVKSEHDETFKLL